MSRTPRALPLVACAVLCSLLVSGCGSAPALRAREAVVTLEPGATQADRDRIRAGCAGLTHTSPEPESSSRLKSDRLKVRFRIDNADDRDLARLTSCLYKFPFVVGVSIPDGGM